MQDAVIVLALSPSKCVRIVVVVLLLPHANPAVILQTKLPTMTPTGVQHKHFLENQTLKFFLFVLLFLFVSR